ncbi:hypothetical protein IFT48_02895 [Pseudomonas fluorescens]|uniref:hypothetical protein n=1 Tax=Pseudomonas TaxID=286 RepID=UPI0013CEC712|nr:MULTISPECIES: hypothetical protein [Pseudomonas]MBD8088914.1 hypothetical protein [Pseudomonas fluorescens]MBD8615651.1 hypothetical protein [Pseudomonas putida]MBD8681693.1 hypothetical protein [Pseudomonas sp. CFBP 13719]
MNKEQMHGWLHKVCEPVVADRMLEQASTTGRSEGQRRDGRHFKLVFNSVHNEYIVQW